MKRSNRLFTLVLLLSVFMLVQCSNEPVLEPNDSMNSNAALFKSNLPNNEYIKVFHTTRTIEIDGTDKEWVNAPKHVMRVYYNLPDPIDDKSDLYSYFRMAWDDQNVYVFVNVQDNVISVDAVDDFNKDSFELFLDGDNSKNGPADANIPHPYPGSYDFNDEQMRFIWQQAPTRFPWFYDPSPIDYAYLETEKGWNVEIKIPFSTLNDFPAEPGHVFGVEFHVNDNDGTGRENFVKWNSESDFTFLYPSLFGSAYLFKSNGNN